MYTLNMQCDLEGILCCKKICTEKHPTHPNLLYDCPSWSKVWTKSVPNCSGSTSMGSCSMKTPTSSYRQSEVPSTLQAPSPVKFLHILVEGLNKVRLLVKQLSDVHCWPLALGHPVCLPGKLLLLRQQLQAFLELLVARIELLQLGHLLCGSAQKCPKFHAGGLPGVC